MKTLGEIFREQKGGSSVLVESTRQEATARTASPCGCGGSGAGGCGGCAEATEKETLLAPLFSGWAGTVSAPHERRFTAAIPHLDTIEPLKVCVEVLRAQSERPYILVIDTGSPRKVRTHLEAMRAADLEVHFIAGHSYRHASEPVAIALDLAQSLCRSKLLFHTHADCFLMRRDFLEEMAGRCNASGPVIGYRMSPRAGTEDWRWMVSHTATTLHMPTIRAIGASWSMQRMHSFHGVPWKIDGVPGGWPDTETGFGYMLREAGIRPEFIGDDVNGQRQTDANIDHVRSYAGSKLYEANYHARARGWMNEAIQEARERVTRWTA